MSGKLDPGLLPIKSSRGGGGDTQGYAKGRKFKIQDMRTSHYSFSVKLHCSVFQVIVFKKVCPVPMNIHF